MTGAERIAAERRRQVEVEGWTPEHDARHDHGDFQMTRAAVAYATAAQFATLPGELATPLGWPWDKRWWKPSDDPLRNLEKAGALIAAEIDRLLRLGGSDE